MAVASRRHISYRKLQGAQAEAAGSTSYTPACTTSLPHVPVVSSRELPPRLQRRLHPLRPLLAPLDERCSSVWNRISRSSQLRAISQPRHRRACRSLQLARPGRAWPSQRHQPPTSHPSTLSQPPALLASPCSHFPRLLGRQDDGQPLASPPSAVPQPRCPLPSRISLVSAVPSPVARPPPCPTHDASLPSTRVAAPSPQSVTCTPRDKMARNACQRRAWRLPGCGMATVHLARRIGILVAAARGFPRQRAAGG